MRNANAVFRCNDSNIKPIVTNKPRKAIEEMRITLRKCVFQFLNVRNIKERNWCIKFSIGNGDFILFGKNVVYNQIHLTAIVEERGEPVSQNIDC